MLSSRNKMPVGVSTQVPVTFEDIAIYFSQAEWEDLEEWQKELYMDVMKENYEILNSLGTGSPTVTPDIISHIEREEELYIRNELRSEERETGKSSCSEALAPPSAAEAVAPPPEAFANGGTEEEDAEGGAHPQQRPSSHRRKLLRLATQLLSHNVHLEDYRRQKLELQREALQVQREALQVQREALQAQREVLQAQREAVQQL
ncbi:protein ZNF783-like isoform X2 [Microcaecilia unicolor]|uniref:Protein ZNF783-like isoform X2 n=1 Tax=Microcaecilia unicolor TaxID=1415580 RepID=A0A6P7XL27_9AMPH|nr:protein ZNF783-like isoform X2 [Microcaecilia unicolor]